MKYDIKAQSPVKLKGDPFAIVVIFSFKNSDDICNQNKNTLLVYNHVN